VLILLINKSLFGLLLFIGCLFPLQADWDVNTANGGGAESSASPATGEAPQDEDQSESSDSESDEDPAADDEFDPQVFSPIQFRSIGPALMSGRIADIAVDPTNPHIWYVAAGSGGVWKTTNSGTTWNPIFDNYGAYSIGCVTIDPNNPNNIWVGTGEDVAGRHVGYGDGVYFSNDGGQSFKNVGLKESEHIAKIVVQPGNSQVVYAACQGPLWTPGGQRGLYKSTDGGTSWQQVLALGEYTGVTDVVMHPSDPKVLYAATYEKHRTVWALLACGEESGIHKSTDGGNTWTELKNGIPSGPKGKIGLAISPQNPQVVYAGIELPQRQGGFFRSANGGVTFQKMSDYVGGGTGPHYYQEIWTDPHQAESVYHADVRLGRTDDGGATFESVSDRAKHVDNHAIAFHPSDPHFLLVGCDGGVYVSYDRCESYRFVSNLPLTQFYKVAVDYDYPFYHIIGGTQDNNTQYGPTATNRRQGIANRDWRIVIGGDGHDCAIDPEDPNIIYGESQQGFIRRYDRRTGQTVDIRPQPPQGDKNLRFNWDSPIELSFHDHKRLYFASNKLHRSDDRGNSWTTISPDLTRQQNRLTLPILGGYWSIDDGWDLDAMSQYNTITSIGESPLDEDLIYVGTDDGLIQVTEDGGETWREIDLISGLPEFAFVNDIKACRHDADTVFACFDNHKYGDYQPYVMKSTDRGKSWSMITEGVPDRHLCWRVIQDHEVPDLLFLATEFGVYATRNGGEKWFKFSNGLPVISVRDLEIQRRENDLVAATFGRSFYVLDDYSPLREATPEIFEKPFHLFAIKTAKLFPMADYLGGRRGSQGNGFFVADNPQFGAVLTYFNRDEYKTAEQKRKEKEKEAKQEGRQVPIPTVEDLVVEQSEQEPELVFSIRNADGDVVQRIQRPLSKGMHRISWDLRNQFGAYVLPGTYQVTVEKLHQGLLEELQEPVEFEVELVVEPTLPIADRADMNEYFRDVNELQRKISAAGTRLSEAEELLNKIQTAIERDDEPHYQLMQEAREHELKLNELSRKFNGQSNLEERVGLDGSPSLRQRIRNAGSAIRSFAEPTQTQRDSFAIAQKVFAELQPELSEFIDRELQEFVQRVQDAGIYGVPGSPVPDPGSLDPPMPAGDR